MSVGEIAKFFTRDGIELQGFLVGSKSNVGILHIPGISGNFYENSFVDAEAEYAAKEKMTFLSMNTRGHDYVNELVKKDGKNFRIINIGGALERFEDCTLDIQAGIAFLRKKGCRRIILQGHSSGCQKIAYYQLCKKDKAVAGLILLAPADDMTIIKNMLGKEFGKTAEQAGKIVKAGQGGEFVPQRLLKVISAQRFCSLSRETSIEARLFNYEGAMKEIGTLTVPLLAVFGERDMYLTRPATELLMVLKRKAARAQCETAVIKNAPHNFRGYEKRLVDVIDKWLGTVL